MENIAYLKQRDATFDIAKALAIIMMCIGHTNNPERLSEFIYIFHMAFFFMASGWCLLHYMIN